LSRQIVQSSAADLAVNDMRPVCHRKFVGHSRRVKAKDLSARKRHGEVPISKETKVLWFAVFVERVWRCWRSRGRHSNGNVSIYFGITGRCDYRDVIPHFHEAHVDQDSLRSFGLTGTSSMSWNVQRRQTASFNSRLAMPVFGSFICPSPSRLIPGANSCHDIAMLHRITMMVAGAMVALSIFFIFRPLQPRRIQPPHPTLAATECAAHPETSAIPAEYSCEKP
jgi:hypothetical protein